MENKSKSKYWKFVNANPNINLPMIVLSEHYVLQWIHLGKRC